MAPLSLFLFMMVFSWIIHLDLEGKYKVDSIFQIFQINHLDFRVIMRLIMVMMVFQVIFCITQHLRELIELEISFYRIPQHPKVFYSILLVFFFIQRDLQVLMGICRRYLVNFHLVFVFSCIIHLVLEEISQYRMVEHFLLQEEFEYWVVICYSNDFYSPFNSKDSLPLS